MRSVGRSYFSSPQTVFEDRRGRQGALLSRRLLFVKAWDVVQECLSEGASPWYRASFACRSCRLPSELEARLPPGPRANWKVSPSPSPADQAAHDSSHWRGAGPPQSMLVTKGCRSCERTCLRKPLWFAIVCERPAVSPYHSAALEMGHVGTPGEVGPPGRASRDAPVLSAVCTRRHADGPDNRLNQFQGATAAEWPESPRTQWRSLQRRRCWHAGLESSACPRTVCRDRWPRLTRTAHSHTLAHCYLRIPAVTEQELRDVSVG